MLENFRINFSNKLQKMDLTRSFWSECAVFQTEWRLYNALDFAKIFAILHRHECKTYSLLIGSSNCTFRSIKLYFHFFAFTSLKEWMSIYCCQRLPKQLLSISIRCLIVYRDVSATQINNSGSSAWVENVFKGCAKNKTTATPPPCDLRDIMHFFMAIAFEMA